MTIAKRGTKYHFDAVVAGRRHRCSLGTSDSKSAARLENRIAFALADGPKSLVWSELKAALPPSSFEQLTEGVLPNEPLKLTELEQQFYEHTNRRRKLVQINSVTRTTYDRVTKVFFDWTLQKELKTVADITPAVVESYLLERKEAITSKGGSGRGIITDLVVLTAVFNFALDEGVLSKNPLRYKPKLPVVTEPVRPFTDAEMAALEFVEKPPVEKAVFAVFKYTGLRVGDVADLRWSAFDFKTHTLRWRTAKRGKTVEIPFGPDLGEALSGLEIEGEPLLFPGTRANKLYRMVRSWGEKAEVENCHPHRFRHYRVCSWLAAGLTLYDVAQLIGDTAATVEKHYAKWTTGQAERVRKLMGGTETRIHEVKAA